MLTRDDFQRLYEQDPDALWAIFAGLQATALASEQQRDLLLACVEKFQERLNKDSDNRSILLYGDKSKATSVSLRSCTECIDQEVLQDIKELLEALRDTGLESLSDVERNQALGDMQALLVEEMRALFDPQLIEFAFDPTQSTSQLIKQVLETAVLKQDTVARHLIGAVLELRFPGIPVANESYWTDDAQTGRSGDFQVRDAVFHVTVNPALDAYEKCKRNISAGLRPYLLVVEDVVLAAKQQAKLSATGKIEVSSVESFVAQNLDELSVFTTSENPRQMLRLLQIYNRRVEEAETDKSLLIEIPANLQGLDVPDQLSDPPITP